MPASRTGSSGWRRGRASARRASSACAWASTRTGSRRCSSPITSARPRCFASRSSRGIRRSTRPNSASTRPRAPTSSAKSSLSGDLFGKAEPVAPLADALRPKSLDEVVGQEHLLGPGMPLRLAFESGRPHSMILWGPPGSGKTTIARLMAKAFNAEFVALSAVFSGVKDIRDAVAAAQARLEQFGRRTILFVDEVHRFNKAQQDAFLPFVEQGLITFVGATTENPSFEVNSALLSRATVYVLEPLQPERLAELLDRTDLAMDEAARARLIGFADGELALAEAVVYLALAPKSNAIYEAYNAARDFIAKDGTRPVPLHIRNASTPLMKQLGSGRGYRYAHEEADAYAAGENYLPEGMPPIEWYRPTDRGLEARLRERLAELRQRDAQARKEK